MSELGLDLTTYYKDVSKIVRSKFPVEGHDADDLVQEVCKKIVKLNKTSPYDPEKSSVSHYVYMVASGVFSSSLRKNKKCPLSNALSFEHQIKPLVTPPKQNELQGYVADFANHIEMSRNIDNDGEGSVSKRILVLTAMGYTKKEIANLLNVSFYRIDKERRYLKEEASKWASSSRT